MGRFLLCGSEVQAHRLAYEFTFGAVDAALHILHSCDNPLCCNQAHLRPGTHLDNMRDRDQKGRRRPPKGGSNGRSKLTEDQVRAIREDGRPNTKIAAKYRVSNQIVSRIKARKAWPHL